jgi:hypothetical protein
MPVRSQENAQAVALEIAPAVATDDSSFVGVRLWAIDPHAAERLWWLSEGLRRDVRPVGLKRRAESSGHPAR